MSPFWARYRVPVSTILGRVAVGMNTVASDGILCFLEAISRLTPKPNPAMSASSTMTDNARLILSPSHCGEVLMRLGEDEIPVGQQHVLVVLMTCRGVRGREDHLPNVLQLHAARDRQQRCDLADAHVGREVGGHGRRDVREVRDPEQLCLGS